MKIKQVYNELKKLTQTGVITYDCTSAKEVSYVTYANTNCYVLADDQDDNADEEAWIFKIYMPKDAHIKRVIERNSAESINEIVDRFLDTDSFNCSCIKIFIQDIDKAEFYSIIESNVSIIARIVEICKEVKLLEEIEKI